MVISKSLYYVLNVGYTEIGVWINYECYTLSYILVS